MSTQLDPLEGLSTEEFRQKMAGLLDPVRATGDTERKEMRETGVRFLTVLAKHYKLKSSREEMWGDVVNVVTKSVAKLGGSPDLERLVNDCLAGLLADDKYTIACPAINQLLEVFEVRDEAWRSQLVVDLHNHLRPWAVHARRRWEQVKEGKVDL